MQLAFIKTGLAVLDDRGVVGVCVNERGLFLNGADERELFFKILAGRAGYSVLGLELHPVVTLEHSRILFQLFRQ